MYYLAINKLHKGKMPVKTPETAQLWREYTQSFENVILDVDSFQDNIYSGYSYCAQLKNLARWRSSSAFMRTSVISLDFDSGDVHSSFDYLAEHIYIQKYASFLYSTPSSTPENPKTRAIFLVSEPITNPKFATMVTKHLISKFDEIDSAMHDPSRIFYGSEGCEFKQIGRRLPLPIAKQFARAEQEKADELAQYYEAKFKASGEMKDGGSFAQNLVDQAVSAPNGTKAHTLNKVAYTIGGLAAAGKIDGLTWIEQLISSMISYSDCDEYTVRQIAESGYQTGSAVPFVPAERPRKPDPFQRIINYYG